MTVIKIQASYKLRFKLGEVALSKFAPILVEILSSYNYSLSLVQIYIFVRSYIVFSSTLQGGL